MKTKVEIEGYEIEISFEEGVITVTAEKDDEIVEEFSINVEEGEEGEDAQKGDIKGFGDYDEEEDFSGEDLEDELEGQDDDEDDEEDDNDEDENKMPGAALESFQSFINKKK